MEKTKEIDGQEALDHLNQLKERGIIPDEEYCLCEGKAGSWRMLPNGATCFYCPPVHLRRMARLLKKARGGKKS